MSLNAAEKKNNIYIIISNYISVKQDEQRAYDEGNRNVLSKCDTNVKYKHNIKLPQIMVINKKKNYEHGKL